MNTSADLQVTLKVMDSIDEIILSGTGEYSLGRVSQDITQGGSQDQKTKRVDIDLTKFQAYEAGVSRRHALIIIKTQKSYVMDLGSTNGSRLNGAKIAAFQLSDLSDGDIITLGSLKISVAIRSQLEPS